MTATVVIAFPRSFDAARAIAEHLDATLVPYETGIFSRVFDTADRIVALMATGIVIRSVAPLLESKWIDPAVVVVTPDLSYAIPLIGGHHGANELAQELAPLGIRPVISTATEALGKESVETIAQRTKHGILNCDSTRTVNAAILKGRIPMYPVTGPSIVVAGPSVAILLKKGTLVIGIGCRKGVTGDEVTSAIESALRNNKLRRDDIFACATTEKKINETGLWEAAGKLPANLVFLDDGTINAQHPKSPSRATRLGLRGVAEPCALALAPHKELIMKKKVYGRVTLAIAR